jgi:prephenate dehydrogenase
MTPGAQRVHVVGAGLMGASIALAADAAGWSVTVEDVRQERANLLEQQLRGRGAHERERPPDVVCVAVPPALIAACVVEALATYLDATVIDIGSVKARPLAEVMRLTPDIRRFVPSHPLAGSELSGPNGARSELFRGRTWVICPEGAGLPSLERAEALARACGATPLRMPVAVHDRLVAVTSHLPQLLASSLAEAVDAAFAPGPADAAPLHQHPPATASPPEPSLVAGPALLDMTRIASSPATLWADVAEANREALRPAVRHVLDRLLGVYEALATAESTREVVTALVEAGAHGRARISPKHTSAPRPDRPRLGATDPEASWVWVDAVVDDAPGALARLFQIADELQVNIEDLHVDHAPHASTGVVSMAVRAQHADRLRSALGSSVSLEDG